jgi:alpha-tubulin suppressor-like RCC1 family protein
MAKIGFEVGTSDGDGADLGDLLVPREFFSEGGLYTWGSNFNGQLGINSTTNRSTPVQTTVGGTNWKQVAIRGSTITAIKTDGTLWGWSENGFGGLGNNDTNNRSTPVQTTVGGTNWKQCGGGQYHTSAIKTDGTLWTWGNNGYGQLGTNDIVNRSTPVQTALGGTNWKQVSSAQSFYTTAIKTDGTLWVWGNNGNGQLGTNDIAHRSTPVQTTAGGTNWKQVSGGVAFITAIKTDGTLWVWGANGDGQLGTNDIAHRSTPVQTTAGGTNWKQVSGGNYYISAIKTDGTLWSWGRNTNGGLGTNDIVNRSTPVQTTAGGTNWKQVYCGYNQNTAIKTDGTFWVWGLNSSGQLGTNDIVNRSTPVQTALGGTNWKQCGGGSDHTSAIKDDIS